MQASFSGRTASILKCERTIRWRPLLNTPKAIQSKSNVSTIIREGAIQPALQSGRKEVKFLSLREGVFSLAGRLELGFIEPSEVLAILCDYSNKAADIWSNVDQSSSERVGNTLGVELYDVQQTCSWRFTLFSGQFDCRIRVEQRQENEGSSGLNPQLQFKLIKSSFMKDFEGSWKVSKEGNGVVVEHLLSVRPMIEIPQSLSSLSQGIFCAQVQATLTDLENEVERLRNRNNN